MAFKSELIAESTSADTEQSTGIPVISIAERWRFRDDTHSLIGIHQARLNFQSDSGIIPGVGYRDYKFALCQTVEGEKIESVPPHQAWEFDVKYSTMCPLIDDPVPANRRWIRYVSDTDQQRFVIRDRLGKLIVDAAGTPFDGGVPANVKLTTYNWEHNTDWAFYNQNSIGELSGRINSDTFLGKPPRTLLLAYSSRETYEGIYHFAAEVFTAIYDPQGWNPKPANAGLYQLIRNTIGRTPKTKTTTVTRDRIMVDGSKAIEPEPLYPDGSVVPQERRPQDCNFIEVDFFNPLVFSSLGLPTI